MPTLNRREAIISSVMAVSALTTRAAETATRVLVVVGPTNHPPGTHEVAAGGRLIKHCLETNKIPCTVISEWPAKPPDDVSSVVFIGDLFLPR